MYVGEGSHRGSERNLFYQSLGKGIEIKFRDSPKLSRSMRIAMEVRPNWPNG